jgi:hypothetical protein
VRILAEPHPLAGQLLWARHVYRRYGRIWLVVVLADGGMCSVAVEDTDVLAAAPVVSVPVGSTVLSIDGARGLLELIDALGRRVSTGDGQDGAR